MLRFLLLSIFFLFPIISNAEWIKLGQGDVQQGQFTYYYDPSTINVNGDAVTVDSLMDFNNSLNFQNGKTYKSIKETDMLFCSSNKAQRKGVVLYLDAMGQGSVIFQNAINEVATIVTPDSPLEMIYKKVCKTQTGNSSSNNISSNQQNTSIGPLAQSLPRYQTVTDSIYTHIQSVFVNNFGSLFVNCQNMANDIQIYNEKINLFTRKVDLYKEPPLESQVCSQIKPKLSGKDKLICRSYFSGLITEVMNRRLYAEQACINKLAQESQKQKNQEMLAKLKSQNDESQYENNKLHVTLVDAVRSGNKCQLHFKLTNKTNFNLSKNSLIGQIIGGNNVAFPAGDGYERVGNIINFQNLPSGSSVDGYVPLNFYDVCTFDVLSQLKSVRHLGFSNPSAIVQEGITSSDFIRVHSLIVDKLDWRLNSNLDEASRLRDPIYRARREKINTCLSSCQRKLESCVITYKSAANRVCGMPNATCMEGCRSIK
jgi:hypothetical protein